jgi:hypothetical protein
MALIKSKNNPEEGEAFCKWLDARFKHNKNVLGVNLGATGSGKSWRDLRMAELWYKHNFNEPFPPENICFGIAPAMKLIAGGKLRKGEIIIFEEAGVNLGSRDWSSKVSKMFNYILQSFRSMNIGLFFNMPYLSMLDSQARHLLHYSFESYSVDYEKGLNYCKPFFHQVNQGTGKIYKKYLRVKTSKGSTRMKTMAFFKPSPYLIEAYEAKKKEYLAQLTTSYSKQLNGGVDEPKLKYPSDDKWEAFHLYTKMNATQAAIAKHQGKNQKTVGNHIKEVENWIKVTQIDKKSGAVELLVRKRPALTPKI